MWKPQDIPDFPLPQKHDEMEHHFVVRCLTHPKHKKWRQKYFKENARAIGDWARKRYSMKAEEAQHKGKEADFKEAAKEKGTWRWQSGLYGPETGKPGASRGGEPVQKESDVSGIVDDFLPEIQDVEGMPGTPVQYGKKDARGMGNTEATKNTDKPVMLAKDDKVGKVMHEWKEGTLKSGGSGKKVTDRSQAIAIGLSEAGLSRPKHK
jgi:hypothetical protein